MSSTNDTKSGGQGRDPQTERDQGGGVGPTPGRPKNAPPRIPGQLRDPDDGDEAENEGEKDDAGEARDDRHNDSVAQPSREDAGRS